MQTECPIPLRRGTNFRSTFFRSTFIAEQRRVEFDGIPALDENRRDRPADPCLNLIENLHLLDGTDNGFGSDDRTDGDKRRIRRSWSGVKRADGRTLDRWSA